MAALGELSRVMEMTVDLPFVLVVGVLSSKHRGTHRTGKVLDMVFAVQCCDIRPAQSSATLVAQEVQSPEVIRFTEWELARAILRVDRKELGCDDFPAVLKSQTSACNRILQERIKRRDRQRIDETGTQPCIPRT